MGLGRADIGYLPERTQFGALIKATRELQRRLSGPDTEEFLEKIGARIVRSAKRRAPKKSNALKDSIKMYRRSSIIDGAPYTTAIMITAGEGLKPVNYAVIQEFGTIKKDYPISARTKSKIRYFSRYLNRIVFRRAPLPDFPHPGIEPRPFMAPALEAVERSLTREINKFLTRTIKSALNIKIARP